MALAKAIGSSQARVAKMEGGDPQASIESFVRALAVLGQPVVPVAILRQWLGPGAMIGLSITSLAQIAGDDVAQADYLGVGPISTTIALRE